MVFADVTEDTEYFGVIAREPVNEQLLDAAMTASGEAMLAPTEYKSVQIYTEELGHENQAIAVLDNNTTVLGTILAIQDVIDAKQGTLAGISGPVYDAINGPGTPLVSLAVAIPPEALADLEDSIAGYPGIRHDAADGRAAGHNHHSVSSRQNRPGTKGRCQIRRCERRLGHSN